MVMSNLKKHCLILFLVQLLPFSLFSNNGYIEDSKEAEFYKPQKRVFKAGASSIDITGEVPSGYTVHDNLHARALVLDDGLEKLVFVVLDQQSGSREVFDRAKEQIRAKNGIPVENIMMSATHTHSVV